MKVFAIDPGTNLSGFAVFDIQLMKLLDFGKVSNDELKRSIARSSCDQLVIEQIKSYGMPIGDTTLETCVWIGRFVEAWGYDASVALIPRKTVCSHICGSSRAKDSNIRRSVLDRFMELSEGNLGGGSEPALGTKAKPGPLYGVSADVFSAIALALTFADNYAGSDHTFLE